VSNSRKNWAASGYVSEQADPPVAILVFIRGFLNRKNKIADGRKTKTYGTSKTIIMHGGFT